MSSAAVDAPAFTFPRPVSPTKDELKPNPHPYPIKTTSTALLSRSNSSPRHHAHHSSQSYTYVPVVSPVPSPASPATSPNYRSHRYSRSLTSDSPRPLPVPPSPPPQSPDVFGPSFSPKRIRRADTVPIPPPVPPKTSVFTLEDLPANPKTWTPSQLCIYLATALRVRTGETLELPERVAHDIAHFVKDTRINGRVFLRLTDSELEVYGINKLWRNALLAASRNLRQNVVKGRIWGFGNSMDDAPHSPHSSSPPPPVPEQAEEEQDEDGTPQNRPGRRHIRRSSSVSFAENPFVNGTAFYSSASSSSSVEDLSRSQGASPVRGSRAVGGNYRNGRVKGMIHSYERTSADEGRPPFVRERTGSTASTSSSASLPSDDEAFAGMYATAKQERRPLPIPPAFFQKPGQENDEEPTIEELLAMSHNDERLPSSVGYALGKRDYVKNNDEFEIMGTDRRKRRGVHAWEADPDDVGIITMKRAPEGSNGSDGAYPSKPLGTIFSEPSSVADMRDLPNGDSHESTEPVAEPILEVSQPNVEEAQLIQQESQLQEQVDSTRTLIEQFKARLVDVESKIQDMEERQAKASTSQTKTEASPPPSGSTSQKIVLDTQSLHGKFLSTVLGIPSPADGGQVSDEQRRRRLTAYEQLLNPKSITALPSYVILVSLGMCAVVMKVVLRRTLGRK